MKKLLISSMALAAFSAVASATVLWDQPYDGVSAGVVAQKFSDFPTFDTYASDDMLVNDPGWHISKVTVYGAEFGTPAGPSSLKLAFGFSPDATAMIDVTSAFTAVQTGGDLTFSEIGGVDVVGSGTLWIFAWVDRAFGTNGQWFWNRTTSTTNGSEHFMHNPGGGFGFGSAPSPGTAWFGTPSDLAFKIEGEKLVPEPASIVALAAGGLALLRRRAKKA